MDDKEIRYLITQIQRIISNEALLDNFSGEKSVEFQELEKSVFYLSKCLHESDEFLYALCNGELDVKSPGRYNFLAGNLKELHSILKSLTWQSIQVAHGDYHQRVNFLGKFSEAFNLMVKQLEEREIHLKEQSEILFQSTELLASIMDTQKDGIFVIDANTKKVIYTNSAAQKNFYDVQLDETLSEEICPMIDYLKNLEVDEQYEKYEYYCERLLRYYEVASYPINWNGRKALVHYIKDVSIEKEKEESLFTLAYQDDLTGVYNRRYCLETLMKFVDNRDCFSLVVLDLDGMKHVNDMYGHLSGDDYLCSVVEVIKDNLHDSDLVFRIGGDEFVVILKDSNKDSSYSLMAKIREDIRNTKKEFDLSISYGITYVSGGQYHSPKEILSVSDERMYEFKKEHRNKKA